MSEEGSGVSLLAIFRRLTGRRTRALILGASLLGAGICGMPIRPEEIEQHMRIMSQAQIVQTLESEQQPSGDPPELEGEP